MRVFTIGFTKKSARRFFGLLRKSGARRVVDVRLHNVSQLAGFAKRDDLAYFLAEICGLDYVHVPELAPTKQILDDYRKRRGDWSAYEKQFLDLMRARRVEQTVEARTRQTVRVVDTRDVVADGCLLCSEAAPDRCHRRLVVEYLEQQWGGLQVTHLG